jgi:hypothetical protein
LLIVLRDPLEPHPHDPDVKALLRVAVVCSIPSACNRATADLVIPPPLRLKLAAGRAIRGIETHLISPLIMGSPTRRLINPITRCWAKPHNRYAGTDDEPGR